MYMHIYKSFSARKCVCVCFLCLIKNTMFLLTMAATIRRSWATRGSTPRGKMSRMGQRCWTGSCLSSFQTVLSPHRWDLEWSKVWPWRGHSPSSPQRGAKRAKGRFRWSPGSRPRAIVRKVQTLARGAPRERRAVWGTEPGSSLPGTSEDTEEDRSGALERRSLASGGEPISAYLIRFGTEKTYLCIFIPSNNFIQCLLYVAD